MTITPEIIAAMETISTATISTVLLKHGLRTIWPRGTKPLAPWRNALPARHSRCASCPRARRDLTLRIDDEALDVTADDILVLRNAGPRGAPGPEAGYVPIPRKLARAGVKDMVRISDARMSGTAFGTIVLHITPEAALGGPLAVVQSGDMITLDVEARTLTFDIAPEELARRLAA